MSDLPCFHTLYRGVHVFYSRVEDWAALALMSLTVNWPYVRAQVAICDLLVTETALIGADLIEVGECAAIQGSGMFRRFYWHPCELAKLPKFDDASYAARALRATLSSTVYALVSGHSHVLHRTSGGLDSSIVLACLQRSPSRPAVTCINYFSPKAGGDEREFARSSARTAGFRLLERERNFALDLTVMRNIRRTSRPMLDYSGYDIYPSEILLGRELGASAMFTGALGDAIFDRAARSWAGAEYVQLHGLGRGFFNVALNQAWLQRTSVFGAIVDALRDGMASPPTARWNPFQSGQHRGLFSTGATRLISPTAWYEFQRETERFIHPWFRCAAGVPLSKLWMIYSLNMEAYYEAPFGSISDPPVLRPIPTQPVVELCLRIPTYLSVEAGRDRAVARCAFADVLPGDVLARTTKGSPKLWIREVLARNATFVREYLMDGHLISQGLLDRKKVEVMLPGTPSRSTGRFWELIEHIYVESWLRQWIGHHHSQAA